MTPIRGGSLLLTPCSMHDELLHERLTHEVIGAFYAVYNALRYGYLESVHVGALEYELRSRGLLVDREVPVEVRYRGVLVGNFRADLIVGRSVVGEAKAGRALHESVEASCSTTFEERDCPSASCCTSDRKPNSDGSS